MAQSRIQDLPLRHRPEWVGGILRHMRLDAVRGHSSGASRSANANGAENQDTWLAQFQLQLLTLTSLSTAIFIDRFPAIFDVCPMFPG